MSTPSELWALGGTPQPAAFANWGLAVSQSVDDVTNRVTEVTGYELNAKDFGAVGDDTTDDTAALASAFAAGAAQGRTVVIPPGTYRVDQPAISNCTVRGMGRASVLKRKEGATQNRCLRVTGDYVTIRDLTLDGNGSSSGASNDGVLHMGATGISHLTVENCWVRNTRTHALRITDTAGHIRVVNNLIEYGSVNGGYGIIMNSQTGGAPTFIDDVAVMGNTLVRSGGGGYGMMIRGSDDHVTRKMENVRIIGNRVDHMNNPTSGLAIETWSDHAVIANNTITGGGFGISYSGARGAIVGNVIRDIDGPGIEAAAGFDSSHVTCVANVVEDCLTGIAAWGSANWVTISDNMINRCEPGIHCYADDSTVSGNVITVFATGGEVYGIWFQNGKRVTCTGNRVMLDPSTSGTLIRGIQFTESDEIACGLNLVSGFTDGIIIAQSVNAINGTIVGNNLIGCTNKVILFLSDTGSIGQLQRWANAGVLPDVAGSRGGNAALTDLLAELAALGVIVNSST